MKQFLLVLISLVCAQSLNAQKYDWAKGMQGLAADQGLSMAVDAAGNVYITGTFQGTVDFDPGLGVTPLTSAGANNIFLAKYDNAGNYLWAQQIGGSVVDVAYAVRVASSGNIYISGYFSSPVVDFDPGPGTANLSPTSSSYDMFIAKYDNAGNYIWARKMGGTGADNAWSMQLDNAENVYIAGYFWSTVDFDPGPGVANLSSAGNYDIFIGKYDNAGNYLWAKRMGGTSDDKAYSLDVTPTGNVLLTGAFQGTVDFDPGPGVSNRTASGSYDVFFAQFDNAGNFQWANSIGGTGDDKPNAIVTDPAGHNYITGYFQNTVDFDPGSATASQTSAGVQDVFLVRYDDLGNYVWAKAIGSVGSDQGYNICLDDSLNVYLTGRFSGTADFNPASTPALLTSAGGTDIFMAKYTSGGQYKFAVNAGGSGGDLANAIFVDKQYAIYITGSFSAIADFDPHPLTVENLASAGFTDIFIAKYLQCFRADEPLIEASADTICVGDADTLNVVQGALNGATHWQWYTDSCGGVPVDTGASIVVFPDKDMTYYVRGEGGCPESGPCVAIHIIVNPLPVVYANTRESLCVGDAIELDGNSGTPMSAWQWYGPNGFLAYSEDTTIKPSQVSNSGDYIVFGTDTNGCISQPVTVNVQVNPFPNVNILNSDTVIKYGSTVQLAVVGASLYSWSPAKYIDNVYSATPSVSPKEPTTFLVMGIDSFGCRNYDSVFVDIDYTDNLFVPSAFSPNNDGRNDVLRVANLSFQALQEFRVFNRWGQEVFSTTNINDGWDGSFKGQPQMVGTYHYLIRVAVPDGSVKLFRGDVTLVR